MNFMLIAGVFMAVLISALLQSKKGRQLHDRILAAYFLLFALTLLLSYIEIFNRSHNYPYPGFINTSTPLIFLHGPFLWLYISALTTRKFKFSILHLIHFLPFILVFIYFLFAQYIRPVDYRIHYDSGLLQKELDYSLIVAGIAISTQSYIIWGIVLIRQYNRRIKELVSHTDKLDLRWLRFLLYTSIVAYALISSLYGLDVLFGLFRYAVLQPVGYTIASLFVLVLGFFGLQQGDLFVAVPEVIITDKKGVKEFSPDALSAQEEIFVDNLLNRMKEHKPFLNPDLNISALAADLQVSADYLSTILNSRLNMSFFDFVNHYRIEEFKQQCRRPQNNHLSIIGIAFDCGFNSKATFNRVFKRVTKLTPSEFRQQSQ